MMKWSIEQLHLPLKFNWKISRSEVNFKENFIVKLMVDDMEGLGEVAFNFRYGESKEEIIKEFEEFQRDFPQNIHTVEEVMEFCSERDLSMSLRFGIESAFVHYLAKASDKSVSELLGVPNVTSVKTSFSLPILSALDIEEFINTYQLSRFESLKIKINKENAVSAVNTLLNVYQGKIRIDANESWEKAIDVLDFISQISDLNRVEFLEQPLRADCHDEAILLKEKSPVLLMADESVTHQEISDYYVERFHGVNIKLMKTGSYMRAVRQLREAKKLGLKTMLGCMVETSLGIVSAINIAYGVDFLDLDGHLLLEKDPYNFVLEEKGKLFKSDLH